MKKQNTELEVMKYITKEAVLSCDDPGLLDSIYKLIVAFKEGGAEEVINYKR